MLAQSRRVRLITALLFVLTLVGLGIGPGAVRGTALAATCGGTTIGGIAVPSTKQSSTIAEICKNGTFEAGVAISFPWLLQSPKSGKYMGAADFLARKIASLLHVKLKYVDADWSVVIAGLQADKYQVIMSPLLDTPARRQVISFANYSTDGNCYAVLKSNHSINTLADLNNSKVRILTFTGTGNEEAVKKEFPNATDVSIVEPPGGEIGALQEILAGRADVVAIDSSSTKVVVAKYPKFKIVPGGASKCLAHPDSPFAVGMGYRKGDNAMGSFLKAVVSKNRKKINHLVQQYSNLKYWNG